MVNIEEEMENKDLEKLIFENRAWEKAEYPRLHMKEPERFKITEMRNSRPIEKEIHLSIGYHHGESERLRVDKWHLDTYFHEGKDCYGKRKIFNSIQEIKEYIREKYKKIAILPKRWD